MQNLTETDLNVLLNSLNHVLSEISDAEFQTIIGVTKPEAQYLMERIQKER